MHRPATVVDDVSEYVEEEEEAVVEEASSEPLN